MGILRFDRAEQNQQCFHIRAAVRRCYTTGVYPIRGTIYFEGGDVYCFCRRGISPAKLERNSVRQYRFDSKWLSWVLGCQSLNKQLLCSQVAGE